MSEKPQHLTLWPDNLVRENRRKLVICWGSPRWPPRQIAMAMVGEATSSLARAAS
jgi:hypothetical protein